MIASCISIRAQLTEGEWPRIENQGLLEVGCLPTTCKEHGWNVSPKPPRTHVQEKRRVYRLYAISISGVPPVWAYFGICKNQSAHVNRSTRPAEGWPGDRWATRA